MLGDMFDRVGTQLRVERKAALALISVVADARITQLVNGVRGVHVLLPHGTLEEVRMPSSARVRAKSSLLIAIDAQPAFLRKLAPTDAVQLLRRICWLSGLAQWLAIPLIVTAEDILREGSIHPHLAACLAPETPIYNSPYAEEGFGEA